MPVIQQERGVRSVKGLPERWGVRAYAELSKAQAGAIGAMPDGYKRLAAMLDQLTSAPVPIDATDAQLCMMAEQCASECQNVALDMHEMTVLRAGVEVVVQMHGMERLETEDDRAAVARYCDPVWWRRNLRIVHRRARETVAMRLGYVSSKAGKYCSDEAALSRVSQNRRNAQGLANTKMLNVETGQEFTLDKLAAKGTGNNKIRRGELMLRMDGCDEVAQELGHMGLFVTLTAPGAYHAVLEYSGAPNKHYNLCTPRETQSYMRNVWDLTRAKNGRDGIAPYGFRVAEPHHDGCTHWHMVLFMPKEHIEVFKRNLRKYALAEDGAAPGALEKRVTFKEIDPSQGSAAAYMAKYVGKNIGDNKIEEDKNGKTVISKEMRVDAWAGVWGIRQFQPIGQPPVTAYRELRRVPEDEIEGAPEHVQAAWFAANRIDLIDPETGEVVGVKRCDFGEYIKAQGGINQGRAYRIRVATELRAVAGRYGMTDRECPIGVYSEAEPGFIGPMPVYESVRFTWTRCGGVAFDRPWSPVNNCTGEYDPKWSTKSPAPEEMAPHDDSEWWGNVDFAFLDDPDYQDFATTQENRAAALAAHGAALAACEKWEGICVN